MDINRFDFAAQEQAQHPHGIPVVAHIKGAAAHSGTSAISPVNPFVKITVSAPATTKKSARPCGSPSNGMIGGRVSAKNNGSPWRWRSSSIGLKDLLDQTGAAEIECYGDDGEEQRLVPVRPDKEQDRDDDDPDTPRPVPKLP